VKNSKKFPKRNIKKLILWKLIGMEGRLLREQHAAWDVRVRRRARGKRTRNGNQFSLERKNSIFPSVEKCYFGLCPSLLFIKKTISILMSYRWIIRSVHEWYTNLVYTCHLHNQPLHYFSLMLEYEYKPKNHLVHP